MLPHFNSLTMLKEDMHVEVFRSVETTDQEKHEEDNPIWLEGTIVSVDT